MRLFFLFFLSLITPAIFADPPISKSTTEIIAPPQNGWFNQLYVTGAIGPVWSIVGNTSLIVSLSETDLINENRVTNHGLWQAGGGTKLFLSDLAHRSYLNALPIEINYYKTGANITGRTDYNFDTSDPIYNFRAPFTSKRIMLDAKPWLFTFQDISPYLILGVGWSWNTISYDESPASGNPPRGRYTLNARQCQNTAYDVGVGLSTQVTPYLTVFVQYLYTYLGVMRPRFDSNTPTTLVAPPTFVLGNSSALFGFTWKISHLRSYLPERK
jgi:opacity protein-like surface antigen